MRRVLLLTLLLPLAARAAATDMCLAIDNRILGPRTQNRPLPLLAGNESKGFHHACTVAWSVLSPHNAPLPVQACLHGSLLQMTNASACGTATGALWVSTRWVVTSAELAQPKNRVALCQKLETGAWAGTRDFSIQCAQQKDLKVRGAAPKRP